jgi:hypothetical protein
MTIKPSKKTVARKQAAGVRMMVSRAVYNKIG